MKLAIHYMPGVLLMMLQACSPGRTPVAENALKPAVITQEVQHDTDDPAVWLHPEDPTQSLVLGTDKDTDGALYAFDLKGKIVRKAEGLARPNNVDIAYGLILNGKHVDIAVVTERETHKIRVFSLPELQAVDGGGIEVFVGEEEQDPMGVAIYTRPVDSAIFVITGRKSGPAEGYLWQYRLSDGGAGQVSADLVRSFGKFSGKKEIEAIAVDNELGYVYYSDEQVGVRKYLADPDAGNNEELTLFADSGFVSDHEGIAVYKTSGSTGYILVSNQQANSFMVYPREGMPGDPHQHPLLAEVPVSAIECDGAEAVCRGLGPAFPDGVLVTMSNGRVFHYYDWRAFAERLR